MSPLTRRDPKVDTARDLLVYVHEHGNGTPERTPFWRDGQWRCEFYQNDGSPRLKVFQGEVCVHEEPVQGKATPEARCVELRREFTRAQSPQEEDRMS